METVECLLVLLVTVAALRTCIPWLVTNVRLREMDGRSELEMERERKWKAMN